MYFIYYFIFILFIFIFYFIFIFIFILILLLFFFLFYFFLFIIFLDFISFNAQPNLNDKPARYRLITNEATAVMRPARRRLIYILTLDDCCLLFFGSV